MSVRKLLEDILEIKWAAQPSLSEWDDYHFIISADDKNRILGNVNQAIVELNSGECLMCRDGLQALEQKLLKDDYVGLENLSLCDSCRGVLLVSIEDERMRGESGEHDEQQD